MAFFEVEFPKKISYEATGGPSWFTTVKQGFSGAEQRNKNWSLDLGKWSVQTITPVEFSGTESEYAALLRAFFLVVGGKFDAFRLKDWLDFGFTDETIGTGDGSSLGPFQLIKTYSIGGRNYIRTIKKPITAAVNDYQGNALANTVVVKDNGTPTSNYTVDATTGKVTFAIGHAPAAGHVLTASGEFHYPVRFDSDELPLQTKESAVKAGRGITSLSINLLEVRL